MSGDDKKQIGRILLKRRLISQEELDKQLETQRTAHDGIPLASRIAAAGVAPETEVLRALSEQSGVPGIDLNQLTLPLEFLDLVPREVAESSRVLPVLVKDERLFLAMGNPADKRVIDELEFVTGLHIYAYVAITSTLERTIRAAYDAKDQGERVYYGPQAPRAPRGETPVVVDEQIAESAAEAAISTTEFGELTEEVSRVEPLPDRVRSQSVAPRSPAGKRILVVDDEEEIRKLVRRLLTERGHAVIEADRGLLALQLVKQDPPDLIVLDAMLPEVHGFDIARRIKGSAKYGSIPILMMSAVYRGRIAEDLKTNYGIEDYVEKPFRMADLLAKIDRLLAREKPPSVDDAETIKQKASQCLEEGIAAYKAGRVDEAIELLKRGIHLDPLAYRLRYHLALIYGKRGQFYDGIAELERAVELHPKHFPALKNLAVLYEKAGFKNKAVEMWERCIPTAPDQETRESIKAHLMRLL
jgi:DNA-binding response OmpR family regulator